MGNQSIIFISFWCVYPRTPSIETPFARKSNRKKVTDCSHSSHTSMAKVWLRMKMTCFLMFFNNGQPCGSENLWEASKTSTKCIKEKKCALSIFSHKHTYTIVHKRYGSFKKCIFFWNKVHHAYHQYIRVCKSCNFVYQLIDFIISLSLLSAFLFVIVEFISVRY